MLVTWRPIVNQEQTHRKFCLNLPHIMHYSKPSSEAISSKNSLSHHTTLFRIPKTWTYEKRVSTSEISHRSKNNSLRLRKDTKKGTSFSTDKQQTSSIAKCLHLPPKRYVLATERNVEKIALKRKSQRKQRQRELNGQPHHHHLRPHHPESTQPDKQMCRQALFLLSSCFQLKIFPCCHYS